MPEALGGEKTLPASPQKKTRAREEGNIARSQDLSSAIALLTALLAMRALGPWMFTRLLEASEFYFGNADGFSPDDTTFMHLVYSSALRGAACVVPFMLIMMGAGLAVNFLQVGILFTTKPLVPKLDRLNPISGFQRFTNIRTFAEMIKSVLKLTLVGYLVWITIKAREEQLFTLMALTPQGIIALLSQLVIVVWWRIALAMLILGILDYGFQRWQHERDLMMTVQEARQEAKEMEGDPRIKMRVRQIQRQLAMQRMMKEVPKADVVITNPTTYAVALRYNPAESTAPTVIAKGARLIAEKIRTIAMEHDVPIVRKPELARSLFRNIEIGHPIPENLFRAVAEVLAYVYAVDRRAEKIRERQGFMAAPRKAV